MGEPIRVAVTGAGGGVGQSVIKTLQNSEYEVVALDNHPLATGLYAADRASLIPAPWEPSFTSDVLEICREAQCRVLFPGLDTELAAFASDAATFAEAGIVAVVSSPKVIQLCDDKLLTYEALRDAGVSVPTTQAAPNGHASEITLPYPYVLKRRVGGSRSRDVFVIRDQHDLAQLQQRGYELSMFVAQEYIDADEEEYTCGSVTLDGQCRGVIIMRRVLRDGDTYKCWVVIDATIEAEVRKAVTAIRPFGPCNVQLRVKDGIPYVFELNARSSGTTAARALSGFNEPVMVADHLCHRITPRYEIVEQTILRYWNELVVDNASIEALTADGGLTRPDAPRL